MDGVQRVMCSGGWLMCIVVFWPLGFWFFSFPVFVSFSQRGGCWLLVFLLMGRFVFAQILNLHFGAEMWTKHFGDETSWFEVFIVLFECCP